LNWVLFVRPEIDIERDERRLKRRKNGRKERRKEITKQGKKEGHPFNRIKLPIVYASRSVVLLICHIILCSIWAG